MLLGFLLLRQPDLRILSAFSSAALLLLFVALSIQYSLKVSRATHGPRSAINRWASQIQEMEAGEDIHRRHHYPNPPIMAILLLPFAELANHSPLAAALSWFYIKVGLALLCMFWVFRMIETPGRPFPAWARAATVVLSIRPILSDLSHGNINIFILFLVIASLYAFTRGRDFLAGAILALAIACKVTPATFCRLFPVEARLARAAGLRGGFGVILSGDSRRVPGLGE